MARKKNAAAVALGKLAAKRRGRDELAEAGRRGGLKGAGVKAMNKANSSLTAKERAAKASKAAKARWAKKEP